MRANLLQARVSQILIDGATTMAPFIWRHCHRDTEGLNAAAIRKDSIQRVLGRNPEGRRQIQFGGMGEANIGVRTGLFFGDDYSGSSSRLNPIRHRGQRRNVGADTDLTLIGDVYRIEGGLPSRRSDSVRSILAATTKSPAQFQTARWRCRAMRTMSLPMGSCMVATTGSTMAETPIFRLSWREMSHFVFSFSTTFGGNDDILLGLSGIGSGDVLSLSGSGNFVEGGDDVIGVRQAASCRAPATYWRSAQMPTTPHHRRKRPDHWGQPRRPRSGRGFSSGSPRKASCPLQEATTS